MPSPLALALASLLVTAAGGAAGPGAAPALAPPAGLLTPLAAVTARPPALLPSVALFGEHSASDYPSLQAALDSCPSGGTVFVPPGTWRLPAPLVIRKPLTLRGAGTASGADSQGTLLVARDRDTDVIRIEAVAGMNELVLRDLKIDGGAFGHGAPGGGRGIYCKAAAPGERGAGDPGDPRPGPLYLYNVVVRNCAGSGIHLENVNWPLVFGGGVIDNGGRGVHLKGCILSNLFQTHIAGNALEGVWADGSPMTYLYGCGIEGNCRAAEDPTYGAQVRFGSSDASACLLCDFELWETERVKTAVVAYDSHGLNFLGNSFTLGDAGAPPRIRAGTTSIRVMGPASGVFVGANLHRLVDAPLAVEGAGDRAVRGLTVLAQGCRGACGPLRHPTGAAADGLEQTILDEGLTLPQYADDAARPANADGAHQGKLIYVRAADRVYVGTARGWKPLD